jgi:hypothetical protein
MTHSRRIETAAAEEACAADDLAAGSVGDAGCLTCGDVATRMLVLEVDESEDLALCLGEGAERLMVDTGLVGAVVPGDALLVHAGAALIRMPV